MSTIHNLEYIKKEVERLAAKLEPKPRETSFPTYGVGLDGGSPGIIIDGDKFHLVSIDRGQERDRKTTFDVDELLYWVFDGITFWLSMEFERNNRIESQDNRRMMFNKQEELLGLLNPSWQLKQREEHLKILKRNPFDDVASVRATYCKELRDSGVESWDAWNKACEKYPLPKDSQKEIRFDD